MVYKMSKKYPTAEEHEKNWKELAAGIASIKNQIRREITPGEVVPNSKKGSLTILGTGIETIGIAIGDKSLIEQADKVLYCVADPVTVTWLNQLRPDALDLYVLYGEDKARYVTYMQMTEAQLYWVRKGLNVVCLFYGHPGIFVLSTHRAIMIARREGYRAIMKAGVSALDTLCADLGVDPCNPGLQTYEATEALIRRRTIDTTANVVLWQVGLIGEGGFRRLGFLNNNFSYFVNWLQEIYGEDFEITHYIGSRYPTIEPIIEVYKLNELHAPVVQSRINGLSTFYIPPKDVVETNKKVCIDLGMIKPEQSIMPSKTPLREIGKYTSKEMKAFDAFANFKIPYSYKFQEETEASKCVMTFRFDPKLQEVYRKNPLQALKDPRFQKLSDKERLLIASKDSGSIQVAAKGAHLRHVGTENFIKNVLTDRNFSTKVTNIIAKYSGKEAQEKLIDFISAYNHNINWNEIRKCFDFIHLMNLYPWTGIYLEPTKEFVITIIGSLAAPKKSLLYINNYRVKLFEYKNGILKWKSDSDNEFNGFLRPDIEISGKRKVVGKIWNNNNNIPNESNFTAYEVDLQRANFVNSIKKYNDCSSLEAIKGKYIIRTTGRYSKTINDLIISDKDIFINNIQITDHKLSNGVLTWSGGNMECFTGEITFVADPILSTTELFGKSRAEESNVFSKCYGSIVAKEPYEYTGPVMPLWATHYLASIVSENTKKGGLMLWYKWEKHNFLTRLANKLVLTFN